MKRTAFRARMVLAVTVIARGCEACQGRGVFGMNGMNEKGEEARDSSGTRRFSRGRNEHEQKYKYSRRRLARLSLGPRGFAPRFVSFGRERRRAAGRCPFRRVVRSSCASRRRISTGVYGGGVIRARDGADSGAGAARRRASREIFAGRRGERSRPLRPLQGVDDLALRRAAVLREQALLAPAPDVLAGLRHGHRDRVLVHAVRHHLRARVDALDGGLGRVELLLPAVSVLRVGGKRGGGEETARENERRRAPGGCRGASDLRR